MSKLEEIIVKVEPAASPGQTPVILTELQDKLKALVEQGGRNDTIDLRSLPVSPDDHELLKETLGYGEIHASLDAMGITEIYETAIAGIWWITHYNSQDENIAEYIEITTLPEILKTGQQDIEQSERQLQQLIAGLTPDRDNG